MQARVEIIYLAAMAGWIIPREEEEIIMISGSNVATRTMLRIPGQMREE